MSQDRIYKFHPENVPSLEVVGLDKKLLTQISG